MFLHLFSFFFTSIWSERYSIGFKCFCITRVSDHLKNPLEKMTSQTWNTGWIILLHFFLPGWTFLWFLSGFFFFFLSLSLLYMAFAFACLILFLYLKKNKFIAPVSALTLCQYFYPVDVSQRQEHQEIAQKAELQSSSKEEANLNAIAWSGVVPALAHTKCWLQGCRQGSAGCRSKR